MIKVEIKKRKECNYFYSLHVLGHSGFAVKGNDIVCAGVSALVQTAYVALKACKASKIEQYDTGKCFKIEIKNIAEDEKEKIIDYCDFLLTGLFLIEKHYPKYVKIIIMEDKDGTS